MQPLNTTASGATELLSSGGDARILLDPDSGLNQYHSTPYPRDVIAYASSTANDTSADAFARVLELTEAGLDEYPGALEAMRVRLRRVFNLDREIDIVFAASGTDLEYVPLAGVMARGQSGVHNILLGADEVGSGCIHSARGCHFADRTPLDIACNSGVPLEGMAQVSLVDIPVRTASGEVRASREIEADISREVEFAHGNGKHTLVHAVHGSKTGLILPRLDALDRLMKRWGGAASFVIDACQVRIAPEMVSAYLERSAIVMMTGSKFVGGPPFSGFALIPPRWKAMASDLPLGLARVFRRPEWPSDWPGATCLPDTTNPGLQMRLEASVFELERFTAIPIERVERVIDAFGAAVEDCLISHDQIALVSPCERGYPGEAEDHPLEMRTLVTLDVSSLPQARTFEDAQALHRRIACGGIRLGQPVRCRKLEDGTWAGTLRIGLSMPQVVALAALDDAAMNDALASDMRRVAAALDLAY